MLALSITLSWCSRLPVSYRARRLLRPFEQVIVDSTKPDPSTNGSNASQPMIFFHRTRPS